MSRSAYLDLPTETLIERRALFIRATGPETTLLPPFVEVLCDKADRISDEIALRSEPA